MTHSAHQRPSHDAVANSAPAPTETERASAALRQLPSVEDVRMALTARLAANGADGTPHAVVIRAIRGALVGARERIRAGGVTPDLEMLIGDAKKAIAEENSPHLRPVINATGVIVNTNLGRSPLSERAIAQVVAVARGYSNLEYDLALGERGSRQSHTRSLLRDLTGAEDALVVNNNAAATLVALAALAAGREVIIARGELVEIGGGFRVPDVMAQSGARLVEVGTTNRVRLSDYAAAITPETALILSVHPSNFRIIGFTESPPLADLAGLAHERGLALMHDLGSGALVATEQWGLGHEPTVAESLRAGADIICFSGDKLLGGPQAGILLGRRAALERIERHPLMRAIRIDKLTLAALEATLRAFRDEAFVAEMPIWRAIAQSVEDLQARAERLVARLAQSGVVAEVVAGASTVGGGSLPGETLPTALVATSARAAAVAVDPAAIAAALRIGEPPVIARVLRDQILLDLRTVAPSEDDLLASAFVTAWQSVAPSR